MPTHMSEHMMRQALGLMSLSLVAVISSRTGYKVMALYSYGLSLVAVTSSRTGYMIMAYIYIYIYGLSLVAVIRIRPCSEIPI